MENIYRNYIVDCLVETLDLIEGKVKAQPAITGPFM